MNDQRGLATGDRFAGEADEGRQPGGVDFRLERSWFAVCVTGVDAIEQENAREESIIAWIPQDFTRGPAAGAPGGECNGAKIPPQMRRRSIDNTALCPFPPMD